MSGIFGTWVAPTRPIPFSTPEGLAAQARESREEAAAKVLAVLRDSVPARPTLAGQPCGTCAFRVPPPIPPFPLPPFEFAEPTGERRPYRVEFYGISRPPSFYLSSII
ncbi:MAG TPA: hypothetical protein VK586_24090 [Streptosporangiaceae bacterium]|nr:hypothetical protein [Streptosporangiaceae bacterium]